MKKLLFIFALLMCMSLTWAQNVAKIGTTEYTTLQDAVDAAYATTGDVTIELIANTSEAVVVKKKVGLNLTIDGKDKTLTGQIIVAGTGSTTSTEVLTITHLKFAYDNSLMEAGDGGFIMLGDTKASGTRWYTGAWNYAHNIYVSYCDFVGNGVTGSGAKPVGFHVGSLGGGMGNFNIDHCTASGMHSLAQFTNVNDISITNCTLTEDMYHGVSISGGTGNFVIENNTMDIDDDYGIRIKGGTVKSVTLSGNNVEAPNAIVLNGNATGTTVDITSGTYIGGFATDASDITITGGTYSSDVTPDCAEGYRAVSNGDGTWTVGPIVVAKIGTTGYATLNAAAAAVPVGTPTTIEILENLNFYDIVSSNLTNKTITFTGVATDTLTLTNAAHAQTAAHGADLTFENITLKNDNTADVYRGIIHVNKVTINNCEIIGFMMGYAPQFVCNNCTFTASCKFHMWTYGSNCTFNSCTFNSSYSSSGGKAINVYTEQTYDRRIITFNDCEFNAPSHSGNGSAIQINSATTCFVIYVNNCTTSGYANTEATAVSGYESLANNKSTSVATTLYIDGVRVLNQGSCDPVAKIGDTYYSTLQAAADDARANMTGDVTIELLNNITGYSIVRQKAGLNLTIEGNNDTIFGQIIVHGDGRYDGAETLTIQNIVFQDNGDNFYSGTDAFIAAPKTTTLPSPFTGTGMGYNYCHNIMLEGCTFISTSSSLNRVAVKVSSCKNITMNNCKGDNLHSFAQLTGTTNSTFTNDTVTNSKSFVNVSGGAGDHNITNCSFITSVAGGYGIREKGTSGANITLADNAFTCETPIQLGDDDRPIGTINVESGLYNSTAATPQAINVDFCDTCAGCPAKVVLTGGTYNEDATTVQNYCAPGYRAIPDVPSAGLCTVYQVYTLIYNANGGTGTMDTIYVRIDASVSDRTKTVADCAFLPASSTDIFAIWNTKADSTGISFNPGDPIVLNSDTTLYAIWREGYTISYDANRGTGTIPPQSKLAGVDITLSDGTDGANNYLITKTDSTLYRWNTAADESGVDYALGGTYSTDANVTMYAVWRLTLDMTMDSTDVVCYGENNGTDTVKIIGGDTPFQLVLSGTALSENDTIKNIMDRTYIFENLKPGSYTVTLTDVLGKDTITGTFTIAQPDTLEITALTVPTNNPCPLMGVGSFDASVTAQGGNDPGNYTYAWGDDATNVNAAATEVPAKADDIDYSYTVSVTVTDVKACTATATATIEVSPVIVHIDSLHGNTTMKIDTVKQGIMQGCDTIIRNFGFPTFTFNNPAITEDILDTVYNNIPTNYPDSIFSIGYNPIIWTAVDTCGHEVTCEQIIYIYHYPCPSVDDGEGNTYNGVRLGCLCWTDRNLVSTKYSSNGNTIPNLMSYVSENFPNATENVANFGYLYDWYAAVDTATNSIADIEATYAAGKHVQGACPNGWYMPTDEDFKTLESFNANDLRSTDFWIEGGGTNSTGFNAVPGGYYNCVTGRYENAAGNAYFWSCHPVYDAATGAMIDYICEKIYNGKVYSRCNGFSIRCVLIVNE